MADVHKQMTDVDANLQSHGYDLSERHLFSAKVGQLLPVYNKQVVPGDYFEIDLISFLRAQRVNTASYARMRQHIDFFFVPYSQLYHRFPEMRYQREDNTHATLPVNGKPLMSPYVTLSDLYGQILECTSSTYQPQVLSRERFDEFGFNTVLNKVRLADLLGYGNLQNTIQRVQDTSNRYPHETMLPGTAYAIPYGYVDKHVTIWPWLAYQKIWSDFYRNPFFDVDPDPVNFNVDYCACSDLESANIFTTYGKLANIGTYKGVFCEQLDGIFKLRYRQWKKDYFTGLFPDKQFGDVSQVVGSSPFRFKPQDIDASTITVIGNSDPDSNGSLTTSSNWTRRFEVFSGISALDVRRAELLQTWKEKTLRAGYRTQNQQMAHFGVASEYISDEHVKHLGGYSEIVDISEVVSTSLNNTGSDQADGLGELGGKASSFAKGSKIRFKAKDDGIIMAIFSVLPESDYPSFGIAADHMRIDPFDYFTPAFQNLGFEAVTRSQLDCIYFGGLEIGREWDRVLGYAPPYYDMKTGLDRVHGEFSPASNASVPDETNVYAWPYQIEQDGSLVAFDAARRDASYLAGTLPFYYVSPRVVDSVFAVNADSWQDTDNFFVNLYLDIKAVRPMSVLGLPNF